ncbi:peptidoglycan DD-metalloendopeptidase family protein [Candidatus Fermentibacteria bacterium]|nr:peptidoglycan DD-metalloendopeptidase family protein [Candidatus Fermentibacteria bacterium]
MPLGTLHWVPHSTGRTRPFKLTRRGLQAIGLVSALVLCVLLGAAFMLGKHLGSIGTRTRRAGDRPIVEGELVQLRQRVDDLAEQLVRISEREEQILVAGAGLNMDFSNLTPHAMSSADKSGDLFEYIDDIELKIVLSERLARAELMAYDSLAGYFVDIKEELDHTPSIWPARGTFVSGFGPRVDPFTGAVRYHKGIDVANMSGTPVYAPAEGMVVFCGWTGGWGLNMVIRHSDRISTRYAHCATFETVVGQKVSRGDLVARMGSTGRSVGPHLHYEVLVDGTQVDPEDYIIREGPDAAVF